ncbi:MAG TPA: HemK2/MTQ2 family protein methyltransferase [Steroidobacteraceae bacterium]|jgi:release factor glutamine methyltransferase|nr:HemK2/MTQ2 family protein methyltransferase [Steroidobacteraceae bacterium]
MSTGASSAQQALSIARAPLLSRLIGKSMAWGYRLIGKDRYDDYRLERVRGAPFLVTPSVFNPKVPRTGEFLASVLDANLIGGDFSVLDMGTGSGVCAVFAARHAAQVVAVDINPAAVRCAGINALLNGVDDKIELRQGDLFAAVPGEKFDLVLFNPPFLRGTPDDDRDRAWRSSDVAERFSAGLSGALKPEGFALVLLSTFGDPGHFLDQFYKAGLDVSVLAERRFVNETLTVFKLQRC